MITCKKCKKFAKLNSVIINGLDQVKLVGSCKYCGYKKEPKTTKNGKKLTFPEIGESKIDYDDFEELGINR